MYKIEKIETKSGHSIFRMTDDTIPYKINVPEEVHWKLVKLAANQKLSPEEYAVKILTNQAELFGEKDNN